MVCFTTLFRTAINPAGTVDPAGVLAHGAADIKTTGIWTRLSDSIQSFFRQIWTERNVTANLRDRIEKSRIFKLHEALNIVLTGPKKGQMGEAGWNQLTDLDLFQDYEKTIKEFTTAKQSHETILWDDYQKFTNRVLALRSRIKNLYERSNKNGFRYFDSIQKIREELGKILQDPIYQKLKDQDLTHINFLQILCVKLSRADGNEAFRAYAKDLSLVGPNDQLKDLETNMSDRLNRIFSHNRKNKGRTFLWSITHPLNTLHSLFGSHISPKNYNSHQNNPSFAGHTFTRDKRSVQFVWGPGFTGDPIFEHGLLPAYKKFEIHETRFNYQDRSHKSENERINLGFKITDPSTNIDHILLGYDTKAKYEPFASVTTVDQFVAAYKNLLTEGEVNGIRMDEKLLSKEVLNSIMHEAQELFAKMGIEPELTDKKTRDLGVRTMLMFLDAMISSAIIYKQLGAAKKIKPGMDKDLQTDVVTAACKQGIDRGPIQSNALRLVYRHFSTKDPLTQDELAEIGGSTLGRARIVEGRNIIQRKYDVFDHFLHFVAKPEVSTHLHESMKTLLKAF